MNLNLWNTKDIFMTPTKMGSHKSSAWTSAPNEHNSMSDSQFLFGSQFCPENSQCASASVEFSIPQRQDKGSQQNSQENDISIFAKYQSKPQLFGKEEKENVSLNNFAGRFKGVMEQFEENKKKIKEKYDNDLLNAFVLNTKESLQKLQSSFNMLEETLKSVLNDLGNISKTMQETSQSHYGLLLNALGEKNEMGQVLLGMEKRLQEKDTEISDLKSSLQLLKESLEQFTVQQNQQHLKICEQLDHMKLSKILNDLQAFISAPRESHHLKDNGSQTSPDRLLNQLSYSCHLNVLNISPANKDISNKAASENKENFHMWQKSHIPARSPNANKTLCCCGGSFLAKSQERKWFLSQEPNEATPVRKVIQRNNQAKGYSATKHSQLNHPEMDNGFVQNRAGDGKSEELIPGKMNNKSKENRVKQGKPRLPSQRKRMYPSRKGNSLKYPRANIKQETTGKGHSIGEYACRETRESGSISLRPVVLSEKKTSSFQDRKAKKSKLLFLSHENQQPTPNLHERPPGIKGNHCFWPCSSPESSFPQTQIKWLDLFDNFSLTNCNTPVPKNATAGCQLFFDSEYSD
ncbi:interactor of HORMAD1 protein 1 [Pantherophis guttatus]|uniref:Interactor of HORMAD1 protein 1 n=1 Tax=Pantherophis guttatus TaxID=94885 RepID=A0A6P9CWK7_PANGU|nr:interactor of HORMAD1 protein 1 [Pantherophis guttatus]XP_034287620.1 interactor of HORMAD1 protein 1 [Pantherophis guttatus]XP_034287621.1 interactor of HORMAD1 protein 1 [Pantherophis guttatus]